MLLAVLFYSVIIFLSDFTEIATELSSISLHYFLLTFPLTIVTIILSGLRFHLVLRKIGINLPLKDSLSIFTAGLSMLITPGGSGSLIKSYLLKKKTGHSISYTIPIVIYEKWLNSVTILSIIGVLLLWNEYLESKIVFLIGLIFLVFSFYIFKNLVGLKYVNKLLMKTKFTKKFIINVEEFRNTTYELLKPKAIFEFLGITLVIMLILYFIIYLIFISLNSNFDFFSSGQIFFTSLLMGILTFVPGGIVVTEGGMLGMLLNYGSNFSDASVLVLLTRFLTLWFPIILGFIMLKTISKKNFET